MEGAKTDTEEEGAGPPLWVGCDQSWASLGLPLAYMYIPGVQNVESVGTKVCDEKSTLSPQNAKHSPIDEPTYEMFM